MRSPESIFTRTTTEIWGTKNAWSLAPVTESNGPGQKCEVELEIQGNEKEGFHLVMSPAGFFTADYWYETKREALDSARELFGTTESEWSKATS